MAEASFELAPRWMSLDLTDDKSTLVQVMAWCLTAPSHYLSQCWPRSLLPYGVTRPHWVSYHYCISRDDYVVPIVITLICLIYNLQFKLNHSLTPLFTIHFCRWHDVLVMYPRSIKTKHRRSPTYPTAVKTPEPTSPPPVSLFDCWNPFPSQFFS